MLTEEFSCFYQNTHHITGCCTLRENLKQSNKIANPQTRIASTYLILIIMTKIQLYVLLQLFGHTSVAAEQQSGGKFEQSDCTGIGSGLELSTEPSCVEFSVPPEEDISTLIPDHPYQ